MVVGSQQPTMRAARYNGPGLGLTIETLPVPRPGPDEALLRVLAAGVCHTELQFLAGTLNPGISPLTLGHEVVGQVVALGEDADPDLLDQRALVYYDSPCDECSWCAAGQEQLCPNLGPRPGFSADGGFAEYLRVAARNLVPLPDGLTSAAAAPLGCSAGAALHAVRAVAQLQPGETALVYGIGGVGLALIQLARLAGARVLAVGRSAAKLDLARELGAELAIDAAHQDVVSEALRATRSEGADVVFELVGSTETMANSLAILRRRGRLVFVGYGPDRLPLNPLHLVLKELQLRGSLGNTRQELREVVELAACGKLRSFIDRLQPLAEVNQALAALRRGEVVGRIVLDPTAATPTVADDSVHPGPVATVPLGPSFAAPPLETAPRGSPYPAPVVELQTPATSLGADLSVRPLPVDPDLPEPASPALTSGALPLESDLLAFIARGIDARKNDAEFNALARRLFNYQYNHNAPYQAFCRRRGRGPADVAHWRDIPAIPISAFKETLLACESIEGAQEFNSSGTSQPERKSRHFHPGLSVYDLNARLNFAAHVLPDGAQLPFLVLFPPPAQLPSSSLAYWLALMAREYSSDGGRWFVGPAGLDGSALTAVLRQAERDCQPLVLLAASFSLVHFLDFCGEQDLRFSLPPGSRLMDTGGYKGRSRELPQGELYGLVSDRLGLPLDHLVSMYGMTEHSTQFLDSVLRDRLRGLSLPRHKTVPPWARTLVLNPDTLEPAPVGELGLLCHFDLANRASVLAVLSEDLGYQVADGFELVGRAQGTEARGCSIAVDELILAARGA